MDLLSQLNPAQREAVTTTEGPVMVMAGAGSGKTKVLTTRISYIISELGIPTSQILAVTFTNKAAAEMKKRISDQLEMECGYMWISTFHSFCSRLLRMEIDALEPFNRNFVIIDEEDSTKIIKEIMKECEFDSVRPKEMYHLISKSKNFKDFYISERSTELKDQFEITSRKYQEKLQELNLLDFDDLIIKTIELFRKNPDILEKYQRKFQYILIDEFQDTNFLQYDLMFMLGNRTQNIFVVGDDFQSIYSFRGAKIENIRKFQKDFPAHKLILLEENYRSTTEILNLANNIITKNPNQIKKVMFSNNKHGGMPEYYHASSAYDETMFVVNKILDGTRKGREYSDYAVMYRANSISRNFEDQLVKARIPYTVYGGLSFFARKEIKDMISYLRVLVHPEDDFSFERAIGAPKRKIGEVAYKKLSEVKITQNVGSYFEAIPFYPGKGQAADNLKEFKNQMDALASKLELVGLPSLIDEILEKFKYQEDELEKDEDTLEDRLDNIKEFQSVLKETEEQYEGLSHKQMLENLLSDLALRSENDEVKSDNSVRLTTFHQAKGLEFKTVFMVAMEEEIFPSANIDSESDMEEERRICYVGVTRAKDELYLSNADSRMRFGQMEAMVPSRFINEMDKSLYKNISRGMKIASPVNKPSVTRATFTVKKQDTKPAEPAQASASFKTGDKINHKAFGDGLVVSVAGESITVAFKAPYGIKVLKANHPSIRKL